MPVNGTRPPLARPRRVTQLVLAATAAAALVVLSAGTASALPPLDAVDDVASPLDTDGIMSVSLLANDIGQDGLPADCSGTRGTTANSIRPPPIRLVSRVPTGCSSLIRER